MRLPWNRSTKRFEEPQHAASSQDPHLRPPQAVRPRSAHLDRYRGRRHERLLPGLYSSEESLAAKARLELELATSPTRNVVESSDITVAEVIAAYMAFAARYYVDVEGKPTKELENMEVVTKPVRELYADTLAAEFDPKALTAVRQHMIGLGWCRTLINHNIDRIRRAMKWAASEELIPVETYQALRTLAGLRRGRTEVKESQPVKPVADNVVKATLPYLPHHVRVMVELMSHTGSRSPTSSAVPTRRGRCSRRGRPRAGRHCWATRRRG